MNYDSGGENPPSSFWWSLSFTPMAAGHEQITRLLFAAGCSGIWESDKGDKQGAMVAYFPAECRGVIGDIRAKLSPFLSVAGDIAIGKIAQENWMEGWKEYFRPVNLTSTWMVMPPWWPEAAAQAEHILIYPGMAFGTGTHETTRLAAGLLEKILKPGDAVLDVGTGSGVLAILAHKLGAGQIFAIDIDEDALGNAGENCRLNNCEHHIRLSLHPLDALEEKFDLVVANIIAPVLVELAAGLIAKLNPGGYLILSGILLEQLEMIKKEYESLGVFIDQQLLEGEWVALQCRP